MNQKLSLYIIITLQTLLYISPVFSQSRHLNGKNFGLPSQLDSIATTKIIRYTNDGIIERFIRLPLRNRIVADLEDLRTEYVKPKPKPKNILNNEEQAIFLRVLSQLPPQLVDFLDERLVAFQFSNKESQASDFITLSTGQTNLTHFVLILPRSLFATSINKLLSSREKTFLSSHFKIASDFDVQVETDTELSALWLAVIQETAELYRRSHSISEFTEEVWRSYHQPESRYVLKMSKDGKSHSHEQIAHFYRQLSKSPYVSAIASKSRIDDFREYLVFYFLTNELKSSYKITISKPGKDSFTFSLLKNESILDRARKFIEVLNEKPRI